MSDTTIVAVVILGGVFLVMLVAIIKSGIDDALRLWNVMGALTGVAFGGITSYYFTTQSHQQQISQIKADNQILSSALVEAAFRANEATKTVNSIEFALKGEPGTSETRFTLSNLIPENDKEELTKRLNETSIQLGYISDLPRSAEIKESIKDSTGVEQKGANDNPVIPEFR